MVLFTGVFAEEKKRKRRGKEDRNYFKVQKMQRSSSDKRQEFTAAQQRQQRSKAMRCTIARLQSLQSSQACNLIIWQTESRRFSPLVTAACRLAVVDCKIGCNLTAYWLMCRHMQHHAPAVPCRGVLCPTEFYRTANLAYHRLHRKQSPILEYTERNPELTQQVCIPVGSLDAPENPYR